MANLDNSARGAKLEFLFEYASKKQIAIEFGVSERTIERWVRMRILPAPVRLGRTSLFHIPTIQKFVAKQLEPARRRQLRY